jgi:hypothetical protein
VRKWSPSQNIRRSLRCHSETGRRTEEAAYGLEGSCRAKRRGKGTDPRRLWILEEVGCRLQEDVPSCSSGTAQEKHLQENSDSGKLRIQEEIDRCRQEDDQLCRSGMAQERRCQKRLYQGQCGTRNQERTDVWEETSAETGMQQRLKEPICSAATTSEEREGNHQLYQRTEQNTAATT